MKVEWISRAGGISVYLALANAVVTAFILATPIGIGNGSGMIGNSIYRMLIMIFPQSAIAIAGIVATVLAITYRQRWIPGLLLNALVMVATFFLYFAQSRTIERFL